MSEQPTERNADRWVADHVVVVTIAFAVFWGLLGLAASRGDLLAGAEVAAGMGGFGLFVSLITRRRLGRPR